MNYSLFKPFSLESITFKKNIYKKLKTPILENPILNKIEKFYSL